MNLFCRTPYTISYSNTRLSCIFRCTLNKTPVHQLTIMLPEERQNVSCYARSNHPCKIRGIQKYQVLYLHPTYVDKPAIAEKNNKMLWEGIKLTMCIYRLSDTPQLPWSLLYWLCSSASSLMRQAGNKWRLGFAAMPSRRGRPATAEPPCSDNSSVGVELHVRSSAPKTPLFAPRVGAAIELVWSTTQAAD